MVLLIGQTLSRFRITSSLGKGGMGEVFLATDTRLDRQVAIKVLPGEVAADPSRRSRFEREAKALAALNHPNIAAIHEVREDEGVYYLVMELAPGESLAARLERGPMTFEEARSIAVQIAEGLEAAHEQGIVHRDLKPANVQVTPDGRVKILDFGLAKMLESEPNSSAANLTQSPTLTQGATQAGMLMGTAAYMSPEQARGQVADRRSDVWAFGVVLWEMITGRTLFRSDTLSDTLAAVLREDPDWDDLPADVPASTRRVLRRCLEREPRRRLQWIGDARLDLEEPEEELATANAASKSSSPRSSLLPWTLVFVLAGLVSWLGWGRPSTVETGDSPSAARGVPSTWTIPPPEGCTFMASAGAPAVSPDGAKIVFVARCEGGVSQLFLRRLEVADSVSLTGTEGAENPFWSPDSLEVGYFASGYLRRMALRTGVTETITPLTPFLGNASWSVDGSIMVGGRDSRTLMHILPNGEVRELGPGQPQGDEWFVAPYFLPDGKHFLFNLQDLAGGRETGLYVGSTESEEIHQLTGGWENGQVTTSGQLVFWRGGALRAQPFDLQTSTATGQLRQLAEEVAFSPRTASAFFSARDDILVYLTGGELWPGELQLYDRTGEPLRSIGPKADYYSLQISPDGSRVIVDSTDLNSAAGDIWTFDLRSGGALRISSDPLNESRPVWSPNGEEVVFHRGSSLFRHSMTGSGQASLLLDQGDPLEPTDWSADGNTLFYVRGSAREMDIWRLDIATGATEPVLDSSFMEDDAQVSRDGRWLVYQSNESGRNEIYAIDLPAKRQKHAISLGPGIGPRWSRNDEEILFYSPGSGVMSVRVRLGDELSAEVPELLFSVDIKTDQEHVFYDVSPDGERLVIAQEIDLTSDGPLVVRTGWSEQLSQ